MNENEERIVIHVGLGKTGTSFLQREIFPKLDNVEVFGNNNKLLTLETKFSSDKINIISREGLSGLGEPEMDAGRYVIADRLHNIFPHAKIIVVFREKESYIRSSYSEVIKAGGVEDFNTYYERITTANPEFFDFEKYDRYLRNLFDNVLVLWFEELKNDPGSFIRKICDFIGVKIPDYANRHVNIQRSDKNLQMWRIINELFRSPWNKDGFFPRWSNPLAWSKILKRAREFFSRGKYSL